MGMGVLTFDWSQISWIGSPLMGEFLVSLPYCGLSRFSSFELVWIDRLVLSG
jgi:hypothetical protein